VEKVVKCFRAILVTIIFFSVVKGGNLTEGWGISGNAILDYYYVNNVTDTSKISDTKPGIFKNLDNDNRSGFQFRRIYLTFEKQLASNLHTRLRFMMANKDYIESGMAAEVKDAYITWQYLDNHSVTGGIVGSPAFGVITDYWGYRLMEKSASDIFGIRSSRNFGIALTGNFVKNKLQYHLAYGNGQGSKSESVVNNDKLLALSLKYYFMDNLFLEIYGDRKDCDNYTEQGFLAYENEYFRTGAQYTYQNKKGNNINLVSMPLILKISNNFKVVTRASRYAEDEDVSSKYLLGLDFSYVKNLQIMPNIMYMDYEENKSDILSRFTVSYEF